jgi:hypothetical protein
MRLVLTVAAALVLAGLPSSARADVFDDYTNDVLVKVPKAQGAKRILTLTPGELAEYRGAVPGVNGAFLVVKTNEGRFSRLVVQPARQKVKEGVTLPIVLIEGFVTYREGEEKAVQVAGGNVRLFDGFRFSLDLGQVVPASVGGDLRFSSEGGKSRLEPVGKAELYVLAKPLPEAAPKKSEKVVIGAKFEPRFFNGTYKLFDDGRRTATLQLKVNDRNEVSGWYYSGKDGQKYEVEGKIGTVPHAVRFRVTFPRSVQTFYGMLFTGDGRVMTGTSELQGRETAFYAVRVEQP